MIGKFRKKPITITAEKWEPGKNDELIMWGIEIKDGKQIPISYVNSLEGQSKINPGDWVITGIKGEKYCCRADIFAESYEQVEE